VSSRIRPLPHPDPFVDAIRGYIDHVTDGLQDLGVQIDDAWLDPCAPRDATLILGTRALVWNESEGFVLGEFLSGRPGVRTALDAPVRLGGGVLAGPAELARRLESGPAATLETRPFTAGHDGFEDALARYETSD
jgi:hypothetical protein